MTFYKVDILHTKTLEEYGYYPDQLSSGSHKRILVECTGCALIYSREYRGRYSTHQCSIVKDGKKKCFKCNTRKSLKKFSKNPKGSGGVSKLCKPCYRKEPSVIASDKKKMKRLKSALADDIELYVRNRHYSTKSRAKKKDIPFSITKKYLRKLWIAQNGRCYYTNLLMTGSGKQSGCQAWNSPSIDRLVPNKGYIVGNIVWCLSSVNSFKSTLTELEFIKQLKEIKWQV